MGQKVKCVAASWFLHQNWSCICQVKSWSAVIIPQVHSEEQCNKKQATCETSPHVPTLKKAKNPPSLLSPSSLLAPNNPWFPLKVFEPFCGARISSLIEFCDWFNPLLTPKLGGFSFKFQPPIEWDGRQALLVRVRVLRGRERCTYRKAVFKVPNHRCIIGVFTAISGGVNLSFKLIIESKNQTLPPAVVSYSVGFDRGFLTHEASCYLNSIKNFYFAWLSHSGIAVLNSKGRVYH